MSDPPVEVLRVLGSVEVSVLEALVGREVVLDLEVEGPEQTSPGEDAPSAGIEGGRDLADVGGELRVLVAERGIELQADPKGEAEDAGAFAVCHS